MANEYEISAGIVPIDNSSGATLDCYYISAGLVPDDTAAAGGELPIPRPLSRPFQAHSEDYK